MNTKSIRFRILLWYSLTLFLATTFIFGSFYLVTRQILFQQVDKELTVHVTKLSEIATRQGASTPGAMFKQQLYNEFSNIPGMVVVLLDHNGSILRSSLSPDTPYVSYNFLFEQAKSSPGIVFLNQNVSNIPMRFAAEPIKSGDDLLGVMLVAHPIEAIQKSLNSLLATLVAVLAILIFPAILGGHLIAGKIMRPISMVSDKMAEISSEHLDERVNNPKSGDEVEKLIVTFNSLLDRLRESFQRERQFIGDVAHELKTPIATLKSGIELTLTKARTNKEYKQSFNETLIDVDRLSTTIKNILDLAWLGADNGNHLDNHFDLSAVLSDLLEIAVKLGSRKHVIIKAEIAPETVVNGAEDKVARAILNVIDNAIKYTSGGGTVSVTLNKKKGSAIIQIKDTGVGIPKKELSHVFERFYRGSKVAKTIGSGLGLAIAKGIITAHQGSLIVESKVGRGTSVTITLPLHLS